MVLILTIANSKLLGNYKSMSHSQRRCSIRCKNNITRLIFQQKQMLQKKKESRSLRTNKSTNQTDYCIPPAKADKLDISIPNFLATFICATAALRSAYKCTISGSDLASFSAFSNSSTAFSKLPR